MLNVKKLLVKILAFIYSLRVIQPSISISTTTGTLKGYQVHRYGNVVILSLGIQKSTTTASGSNVYAGTINTTALRPVHAISGGTFYASYSLMGMLNASGGITLRNANASTFQAVTGDNLITVGFTYIVA